MIKQSYLIIPVLLMTVFLPLVGFANGGDQRVVDGNYIINLSRAPFTPRVGVKTSMLASFVDIQNKKLVAKDLIVTVRIAKLSGSDRRREFVFEKNNLDVKGGILELAYTFTQTGLHEIFFDFAFASNPATIYEAPDFLIDVQEQKNPLLLQDIVSFGQSLPIPVIVIGVIILVVWSLIWKGLALWNAARQGEKNGLSSCLSSTLLVFLKSSICVYGANA